MNWNWEAIKQQSRIVYARLSQLLVFLAVCFYLLACIVASKPVGPRGHVSFNYLLLSMASRSARGDDAVLRQEAVMHEQRRNGLSRYGGSDASANRK